MTDKQKLVCVSPKSFSELVFYMVRDAVCYRTADENDACPCEKCKHSVKGKNGIGCKMLGVRFREMGGGNVKNLPVAEGATCEEAITKKGIEQ